MCAARGSRPSGGARAVEDLRAGDRITTRDGGPQTLRWIGRQTVAAGGDLAPVAINAGVLGNPRRLCVAPRQRLIMRDWRAELFFGQDEALVEAHELIDGVAVRPDLADSVAYYHLLFDRPEVIFAEGVAVASLDPADHRPGRLDEARRPSTAAPAAILLRAA